VSLVQPKRGQARILVQTGNYPWQVVSMFFDSRRWPDAARLMGEIRRHVANRSA